MYLHVVLLKTHWRLINESITLHYYDNEICFFAEIQTIANLVHFHYLGIIY